MHNFKTVKKPVSFEYCYRKMTLDPMGFTPIMIAVCSNHESALKENLIKLLIASKADCKVRSPNGDNLLHLCTKYCHDEALCSQLLGDLGINLNDKNAQGMTPLDNCNRLERTSLGKEIEEMISRQN